MPNSTDIVSKSNLAGGKKAFVKRLAGTHRTRVPNLNYLSPEQSGHRMLSKFGAIRSNLPVAPFGTLPSKVRVQFEVLQCFGVVERVALCCSGLTELLGGE